MSRLPRFARTEVLACLRDLADTRLQQRSWLHAEPGGPSSPSELVCQLFDDTALDQYLSTGDHAMVFSEAVDTLLRELSARVGQLDLGPPAKALLVDSAWSEIQELAARAVRLIEALPQD